VVTPLRIFLIFGGIIFFPGLIELYLLHNQLKQTPMKTLAVSLNRITVALLVLASAILFFATVIQMSSLASMVITGFITVLSIGIANITFSEKE